VLSKKLLLPALVACSLALPSVVRAQEMGGGGMGGDEKKDEGEKKPDEPKKDEGDKKPDEPKKDEPKADAKKTLAFEAPAGWKEGRGHGKVMKHAFKLEAVEGEPEASVTVLHPGADADYAKEKARWAKPFKDKDGKPLDASAVKEDAFEANGMKGKIAEIAGMLAPRGRHGKGGKGGKGGEGGDKGEDGEKGGDAAKPEAKWTRQVNVYLEGPDGAWILRLQGGDKTVEKYRDDFMKYAKSVKIVEGSADENKPASKKKE